MLSQLMRFVGLQSVSHLSSRLPYYWGWAIQVAVMVVVNVSPLLGLAAGRWGVADLLLFYAIENCLIVVTTVVRLLTYRGSGDGIMGGSAPDWMTGSAFAALIFGMLAGIFTFVGTVLAMVFGLRELEGSWPVWAFNLALLVVGHAVGLALFWFGQGQRWTVSRIASPILMALAPLPRVLGLHVMVLVIPAMGDLAGAEAPLVVKVVVAAKIAWDLGLLVVQLVLYRRARARAS